MKVLSLFSGAGGMDMGLHNAGLTTAFQCEIDKHARAVLDHHWPDVPKWDDVATLTGQHILDATGGVDVVAWGSPCQDLSVAGRRKGLAGERSGLFHHGIRIIKELRELSNGTYPTWSIWENVIGALSSNRGADFGQVLHEMDEAGACFSEWVVLDAQHFGVPQRRRRVFVISCFDPATAAGYPDKMFAVTQSSSGDSAPGRQKKKDDADHTPGSAGTSSELFRMRGFGDYAQDGTASAIKARDWKDVTDIVISPPVVIDRAMFNQGENALYEPFVGETNTMPSLVAKGPHAVGHMNQVRRLTPIECERLMGWPDNHTATGVNGAVNDTNRYKMCGNGVASPVAEWIGKQLLTRGHNDK